MAHFSKLDMDSHHTSPLRRLLTAACLAALLVGVGACTSEKADQPDMPDSEVGIRFGVEPADSRDLQYDGLATTLSDGDFVGCVIGTKSSTGGECDYLAYSKWQYCAQTGMLVLKQVEYTIATKTGPNDWDPVKNIYKLYPWDQDTQANDIIQQDIVPGKKEENDGFVKLMRTGVDYTFHWVYPYVEEDATTADPKDHPCFSVQGQWASSATTLMATYLGKKHDQYNSDLLIDSEWRNALCFVNPDQSTRARLCRSDYMTARTSALKSGAGINSQTAQKASTLPVRLVKLNAAIEVVMEGTETLGNVTFTSGDHAFTNGSALDVELNQRKTLTSQPGGVDFATWMKSTQMTLRPCQLEAGKRFRLVVAPQVVQGLTLNFSMGGGAFSAELSTQLPVLEANHLYTIRLRQSQGHSYVEMMVIRDWVDAGISELDGWTGIPEAMPI